MYDGIKQQGTRIVYGTGIHHVWSEDQGLAIETLDMAFEAGFRTFDTANRYQNAEKNLGAWLDARGVRDQIVLHDKGCNPTERGSDDVLSADAIRAFVDESLDRLRTDHLDFYQLHRDDETVPVGEVIETFNALHEEGRINRFGGSNWRMARVQEANAYAKEHGLIGFSAISPCFNIGDYYEDYYQGSVAINSGPDAEAYRAWLAEHDEILVFTYSALGRSFFSGKYRTDSGVPIESIIPEPPLAEYNQPDNIARRARLENMSADKGVSVAQLAVAWILCQPLYVYPIVSPTGAHIREIADAEDIRLTPEEVKWLKEGV